MLTTSVFDAAWIKPDHAVIQLSMAVRANAQNVILTVRAFVNATKRLDVMSFSVKSSIRKLKFYGA